MRIDKYLKEVAIIKRRSVAKDLLATGHVQVNGEVVKASYSVKQGVVVVLRQGSRQCRFEILDVPAGNVRKEDRAGYYRPLD